MTLFEYLAIAFGLLYSIAALRLLGGLSAAMAAGRRYMVHLGLTVILLLLIVSSFWTFWSLRGVDWTFGGFLLALLVPGLLYFCAAVLIPENPDDVLSWRDHYFAVHRRCYAGFALWGLAAAASATVNLGMPLAHPARAVHVLTLLLGTAGSVSANPRLHAGIVVTLGMLMLIGAIGINLQPGWLAHS